MKLHKNYAVQTFFFIAGLFFWTFAFFYIYKSDAATATASFFMGLISFIFPNIDRFKNLKGWGFEAELWENKSKEADELIQRLKAIVSVYTREVMLSRVLHGRNNEAGGGWQEHWKLYNELVGRHAELGQEIDFSNLKRRLDAIFIFDMVVRHYGGIRRPLSDGREQARVEIEDEFRGVKAGLKENRLKQLAKISDFPSSHRLFEIALLGEIDLAAYVLTWARERQAMLKEHFGIDVEFDRESVETLEKISTMWLSGSVPIRNDTIELTHGLEWQPW